MAPCWAAWPVVGYTLLLYLEWLLLNILLIELLMLLVAVPVYNITVPAVCPMALPCLLPQA